MKYGSILRQKFGQWTVIREKRPQRESGRIRHRVVCRCDCGTKAELLRANLLSGKSRRCRACYLKAASEAKLVDLSGQKFGKWAVLSLEQTGRHPKWRCRCACGTTKVIDSRNLKSGNTKSCGCGRPTGSRHHNWKGGKFKTAQGYVFVLNPDHPNANSGGYVFEHILVMARKLGRPLLKGEEVHHKNGTRDDNRLRNLELWTKRHPKGQRVKDIVVWAEETLRLYAPEKIR